MRSVFLISLLGLLLVPTLSAHAQYRDADMRNRFGVKLMLGLGGEVDLDPGPDVDLETTYGLGLTFESPFHEYVTAGGILAFHSWYTESQEDADDAGFDTERSELLDIDAFIKVRYPTHLGDMGFEPYALIPLGLSINFLSDDFNDNIDTGFGWNSGIMFGAILFVSDSVGINAEFGYAIHNVTHNVDLPTGDEDLDLSFGQAAFNLGIVIALD